MESLFEKGRKYTFEEYLAIEEQSLEKHEFHNGIVVPRGMPFDYGDYKFDHDQIKDNIRRLLKELFQENHINNTLFSDEQKIFISKLNKEVVPDLAVFSGNPIFHFNNTSLVCNSKLIIEVLSDSTKTTDRTTKFENYCSIPSFREYLLVAQDRPFVEAFFLHDPETALWKISRASGLDASIKLLSIDCTLALKDIYRMAKDLKEVE